ncbi:putative cystine transporter YijE [Polaromonas vacuolata]|uniref:Putative cystine transporter YijE n=2 Tax=Polaromonas vacuolata TaxID=37448 RepID=A0A6H2HBN1_9BURK|nr:putative cystine transporter YijE [Polaromonas vacuolata]
MDKKSQTTMKLASASTGAALPILVLLFSSSLFGLTWWPLKQFVDIGLSGPTLSLLAYGPVGLVLGIWLWRERAMWRQQTAILLALALVGGWANTSFVNALMLGDVVRVMFLFYLAPVWSVLGGYLFLGETVSRRRKLAVVVAIAGLWLVLGGSQAFTTALSLADYLALSAGLAFAGNNVLARAGQRIPIRSKTASVFIGCGVLSGFWMLGQGASVPSLTAGSVLAVLAYGFGWMLLATVTWQFGVTHMETGRAGVAMLSELLVAVLTATWFGGGNLSAIEWLGGALIGCAALIEATDTSAEAPILPT